MDPSDRIFVALDTSDLDKALALAEGLRGLVGGVKLGQEFFTAQGPAGVDAVTALGLPVFLDLKFHDIPATVSRAVGAALALKLFMLNVHASGGEAMMWAAADAAGLADDERPLVVAVTVLTSLWSGDLVATGIDDNIEDQVLRLAALAENCDLDGVVCSPREVAALRRERGPDFKLVVPGIRPTWAATDDQKRVETPADTVAAGADYLVIGRPITESQDPADAARRIADEIGK
ncbi:MAG: Orotidine 5'-phosphate decarboxylase [Alphaproteobacteria bacterium MarineAlpha3_Bin3]|nr:MAG: Orotidine 5'-phosphate decarboxylase [Alphaproteobacteria bacterium MarineAlpha3_Bin3]